MVGFASPSMADLTIVLGVFVCCSCFTWWAVGSLDDLCVFLPFVCSVLTRCFLRFRPFGFHSHFNRFLFIYLR